MEIVSKYFFPPGLNKIKPCKAVQNTAAGKMLHRVKNLPTAHIMPFTNQLNDEAKYGYTRNGFFQRLVR